MNSNSRLVDVRKTLFSRKWKKLKMWVTRSSTRPPPPLVHFREIERKCEFLQQKKKSEVMTFF
jgi:hypothetical protein